MTQTVPLLDLKAQLTPLREEMIQTVIDVIDSTRYIMGERIDSFEQAIAEYTGTPHAVGVSSGTDALLLALMALDVGPEDAVITSDFSFFATAGVIARLHAKPIFIDIDPISYNLSPTLLRAKLESMPEIERQKVKAIIPVHLYGQCADMPAIKAIADQYQIPLIEDAAQAIGAECIFEGQPHRAGSMGAAGCFSFFPSKNLGGIGDGGMVVTQDAEFAEKLRCKRVHGEYKKYHHNVIGGNFRLDPLQAAVLHLKLGHLDQWHQQRQGNAKYYNQLFAQRELDFIETPKAVHDTNLAHYHIHNQYVIRVPQRDALRQFLSSEGVSTEVYYPVPFHQQECFQYLGYQTGDFPESEKAAQSVLALPIYPELPRSSQDYIVEKIVEFYKKT